MPFEFAAAPVPVRSDIGDVFRRDWERLASPGTWWNGFERVAVATIARAARSGPAPPVADLPDAAADAASTIAVVPASIRKPWVDGVAAAIGFSRYVEIIGIVGRLAAIDTFHRALGIDLEPLPRPRAGESTEVEEPLARSGRAWVPMVGGASITRALSLVTAEVAAQEDLHGPLYLTYEGMADLDHVGGLTRAQMELVASRTSAINECFY